MAGVKGTKPYTEKEFKTVKKLTDMPQLSNADVARITGRSTQLVSCTAQAKDWADYKAVLLEKQKRYELRHNIRTEKWVGAPIQEKVDVPTKESLNDSKIVSSIESIAESLEVIAKYLTDQAPLAKEAREFKLFGKR